MLPHIGDSSSEKDAKTANTCEKMSYSKHPTRRPWHRFLWATPPGRGSSSRPGASEPLGRLLIATPARAWNSGRYGESPRSGAIDRFNRPAPGALDQRMRPSTGLRRVAISKRPASGAKNCQPSFSSSFSPSSSFSSLFSSSAFPFIGRTEGSCSTARTGRHGNKTRPPGRCPTGAIKSNKCDADHRGSEAVCSLSLCGSALKRRLQASGFRRQPSSSFSSSSSAFHLFG